MVNQESKNSDRVESAHYGNMNNRSANRKPKKLAVYLILSWIIFKSVKNIIKYIKKHWKYIRWMPVFASIFLLYRSIGIFLGRKQVSRLNRLQDSVERSEQQQFRLSIGENAELDDGTKIEKKSWGYQIIDQ